MRYNITCMYFCLFSSKDVDLFVFMYVSTAEYIQTGHCTPIPGAEAITAGKATL